MAKFGRWQLPVLMRKYPHLLALDAVCWSRYLAQNHDRMRRVQYDTWCGTPMAWRPGVEQVPNQSEGCGCKRIDAIYEDLDSHLHLVEVKPYGNYVALGQLLMYADLIQCESPPPHPTHLHIVCFTADPDILPLAGKQGVLVHEVGFPGEG